MFVLYCFVSFSSYSCVNIVAPKSVLFSETNTSIEYSSLIVFNMEKKTKTNAIDLNSLKFHGRRLKNQHKIHFLNVVIKFAAWYFRLFGFHGGCSTDKLCSKWIVCRGNRHQFVYLTNLNMSNNMYTLIDTNTSSICLSICALLV